MKRSVQILSGSLVLLIMLVLFYKAWFAKKRIYNSSYTIPSAATTKTSSVQPCGLHNGQYTATIDYYNPATGVEASYTSNVTIENCMVIKIDFNREGKRGNIELPEGELENDRSTKIEDENGGIYTVQVH